MTFMRMGVLLIALLAGCSIGPRGDRTALALSPRGANIQMTTAAGELHGELLAIQSSGIVVLTAANGVTLVEYEAIRGGRVENGPSRFTGASARAGRHFDQLRRRSRFPQGLQPNVETELLRVHNQSSLVVVRP
jgi:hypothetical protein